jgi:magnesium transporter
MRNQPADLAPGAVSTDPRALVEMVNECEPRAAAELLRVCSDTVILNVLRNVDPPVAQKVLRGFPAEREQRLLALALPEYRRRWSLSQMYPEGTVGRLMDLPIGVFPPQLTAAETIARLRVLVQHAFITYGFIVDEEGQLVGVLVMRELLLADPHARLADLMLRNPYSLDPHMSLMEAMRAVLHCHFPVYPVCEPGGRLVGLVRGQTLFEQQAIEISAQAGQMVGVDKEERIATPWLRSFRLRHPWLQLNLLTAFIAAGVVGLFQGTIDRIVVLAVFLPVLAGQSSNTGCQALAVALRGLTLGELRRGRARRVLLKEALLGLGNGLFIGLSAGVGMYVVATLQHNAAAGRLGLVVFLAMSGSCALSGICGALVPLTLKRLGADPAIASSIFLTTATDVVSMGLLLGLATLLV